MSPSICAVSAHPKFQGGATARCSTRRSRAKRILANCRSIGRCAAQTPYRSSPGAADRTSFYCLKIPNRPPDCGGGGGGGCCWVCSCGGGGGGRTTCLGGARFCAGGGAAGFGASGGGAAVTTVVSGALQSV